MRAAILTATLAMLVAATAFAAPFVRLPGPSDQSLLTRIAGRACSYCRRDCVIERDYCGRRGSCQDQFVRCMRYCWYEYCRP